MFYSYVLQLCSTTMFYNYVLQLWSTAMFYSYGLQNEREREQNISAISKLKKRDNIETDCLALVVDLKRLPGNLGDKNKTSKYLKETAVKAGLQIICGKMGIYDEHKKSRQVHGIKLLVNTQSC